MNFLKWMFLTLTLIGLTSCIEQQEYYEVTASVLNVREEPHMSTIIFKALKGDKITKINEHNNWIYGHNIRLNKVGWMHTEYLKEIE